MNSNLTFEQLTASKPLESYSQQQIHDIRLLSTNKHMQAEAFGSATYKIQKYPGDLDLHEVFTNCCTMNEVINKFARILQRIVKNVISERTHYFSEIKAGLDNRYDIDIGNIDKGDFNINRDLINKKTISLFRNKLLNDKEVRIINNVLDIQFPGGNEYDVLYYIFRERKILRWSSREIIKGYKILPGNKKITLKKALEYKTHVKIDIISFINSKFVEVTNFYILTYTDSNGRIHMINLTYNYLDKTEMLQTYHQQIKDEIEKLYYSNMFYNPFKMAKRIWAMARIDRDEQTIRTLTLTVIGNISFLYQIKSEIEAIIRIFEISESLPIITINKQVNQFKGKLTNIIEINENEEIAMDNILDRFSSSKKKDMKFHLLKELKTIIKQIINRLTIMSLNMIGFNPPPRNYLPDQLKYAMIIRTPNELVVDPITYF